MKVRAHHTVAIASVLAAACSSVAERPRHRADLEDDGSPIVSSVGHRDARLGVPTFAWISRESAPRFGSSLDAAKATMRSLSRAFELSPEAAATVTAREIDERSAGPIVARFVQRVGDIEVFRGHANIMLSRSYEPVAATGLLAPSLRGSERAFALEPGEAIARAFQVQGLDVPALDPLGARGLYEEFRAAGLAEPARAKRVFYPSRVDDHVELEPAFYVDFVVRGAAARGWVISALDGRVLFSTDLVHYDEYSYRVYADEQTLLPFDGPQGNALQPHPTGKPDRMKLTYQPGQLVKLANYPFSKNDPWLPPGATALIGNNVKAYADRGAPEGYGGPNDVMPAPTAGAFDFRYDTSQSPDASQASISAATTHLFYTTNFLHDWFYDAGFDEAGRNHQSNNFSRGGSGGDPLLAEAQDFSGRNNANAQVPPDGRSPIIQMYIFSGPSNAELVVTAPASVAGTKSVGIASGFGADVFDTTGAVVLAADEGGGDLNDACEPLTSGVAGKVVLVHRGTCSFAQKAQTIQGAGGIGVIIANVETSAQPTIAPFMGGQQGGISVPVLSLNLADGKALEAAVGQGLTVKMKRSVLVDLDGALDTTIVAHEWGHVLSGRLVGDGLGLTTNQSGGLGEGWGDFLSLLVAARAEDAPWAGTFAQGAYAVSGSGDDIYFGTRRVPYSVDFTKNALTLKHIQNGVPLPADVTTSFGEDGSFNSEVHNTGEIWATMLWECYVALLRDSRFTFAQAQERMKRYLVASLKLTPVDPTIIEARDAVLAAALAADERDFKLFFEAFARRGAGAGAEGPPKDSGSNVGVKESFFAGNDVQIASATIKDDVITCDHDGILDDGESGTIRIKLRNTGSGVLSQASAELTPRTKGITLSPGTKITIPTLKPFETAELEVKATIGTADEVIEPLAFDIVVTDPSLAEGRIARVAVPTRYNADEAPEAAAIDRVETSKSAWKVAGRDVYDFQWARVGDADNHYWKLQDPFEAGDHRLTSPQFTINGGSFTLSFKHRWSFRFSTRRGVDINGGVVEVSVDRGKTWKDVSSYGKPAYNSELDPSRTDNVLAGREAYGRRSEGYPTAWVQEKLEIRLPEQPETVQVRFRVGSSVGRTAGDGWDIDDIELGGISSTPFYAFVPHADACDEEGPTASAGPPQTVSSRAAVTLQGSATHPYDEPLHYAWSQVEGPAVQLRDPTSATPTFDAPEATAPITLGFVLRANDGKLLSPASRTDVTVKPNDLEGGGSGCATTPRAPLDPSVLVLAAGVLVVVRRRSRRR